MRAPVVTLGNRRILGRLIHCATDCAMIVAYHTRAAHRPVSVTCDYCHPHRKEILSAIHQTFRSRVKRRDLSNHETH